MCKLPFLVLLASTLFLGACSSGGSDSPVDTNAHPQSWFSSHSEAALASADYTDCVSCHGADLSGSGDVVSCYSCHAFNTAPPLLIHPSSWASSYIDHRSYADTDGFKPCAACHGQDLRGRTPAPSCFSANFNGAACHPDGPGEAPHDLGDSYRNGGHGLEAKADLTFCQGCHGELGGPGTSPRFNLGIDGQGCEGCHGLNYGHPQDWQGCTGHNAADNVLNACTLCHGENLDGINNDQTASAGVSCQECHSESPVNYPTDCASCHNLPPNNGAVVGDTNPNRKGQHDRIGHSRSISSIPAETCDRCHSSAGSCTDNHYDTDFPADVNLPIGSDTIIPTWDGSNMTCNGSCHLNGYDYNHNNSTWY